MTRFEDRTNTSGNGIISFMDMHLNSRHIKPQKQRKDLPAKIIHTNCFRDKRERKCFKVVNLPARTDNFYLVSQQTRTILAELAHKAVKSHVPCGSYLSPCKQLLVHMILLLSYELSRAVFHFSQEKQLYSFSSYSFIATYLFAEMY